MAKARTRYTKELRVYLRKLEKAFNVAPIALHIVAALPDCQAYYSPRTITLKLGSRYTPRYCRRFLHTLLRHEFTHALGPWYHVPNFRRMLRHVRNKKL